jgi:glycine cleavage system H protein
MDLTALKYAKSHEWAARDGDVVTVGVTAFAAEQLGDVTHLQLPKVGTAVTAGKSFGEIESVKAVFDLYAPVTGTVSEVNAVLQANPEPVQTDPFGQWMIRITLAAGATLDHLMTKPQYDEQLAADGH